MNLQMLLKSGIAFLLVFIIQLCTKSKYYFISALIPLFPSIAMFSYYFVGKQGDYNKLSKTIQFGMLSLITYFSFLLALLILSKRLPITLSLFLSSLVWFIVAGIQITIWNKFLL
jgi:membrane protein GlpM